MTIGASEEKVLIFCHVDHESFTDKNETWELSFYFGNFIITCTHKNKSPAHCAQSKCRILTSNGLEHSQMSSHPPHSVQHFFNVTEHQQTPNSNTNTHSALNVEIKVFKKLIIDELFISKCLVGQKIDLKGQLNLKQLKIILSQIIEDLTCQYFSTTGIQNILFGRIFTFT